MLIIRRIQEKLQEIEVLKVFSLTAMSTAVKMLTGFATIKVVANLVGPDGIALFGQLTNFSAIVLTLATGGINLGITKYVSEYNDDVKQLSKLLSTALIIIIFASIFCGICLITFRKFASVKVFLTDEYSYVFTVFGGSVLLYSLNMMMLSIVNGFKEFKNYVNINIVNSIVGLIFTVSAVYLFGLSGGLVATISYQSVVFFATIYILRNKFWLSKNFFLNPIDWKIVKKYLNYSIMALTSAATVPISQLMIRGYVIKNISITEAGYWEAMNQLSNMYLMIITTSLSVYYLPTFSRLSDNKKLRDELYKAYRIIMPLLFIGLVLLYFMRFRIIEITYSKEFYPMSELFIWQIIGDFFKIAGWLLAFNMLARSMTKTFVVTEILFPAIFVINSYLLVNHGGTVLGVTQAYLINKVLYFVVMLIVFKRVIWIK
jgi:PST family polysaccharide transporter